MAMYSNGRAKTLKLPECWGHRGASAEFPENTLASYERAILNGSEGIEGDVHVSKDGVIIMCHDPDLRRTTNMQGVIAETNWYGPGGMEHAQTTKEPRQPIPTFTQVIELLMRKENRHIIFDIDIKNTNEPNRLFPIMLSIFSSYPDWETELAPRIVLGIWNPKFLKLSKELFPRCRFSHIGVSTSVARRSFWGSCDEMSLPFAILATWEGERFRRQCREAGKKIFLWTVNDRHEMMEAVRWGVDVIITDVPDVWLKLRSELEADYERVNLSYGRSFLWRRPMYWRVVLYPLIIFRRLRNYTRNLKISSLFFGGFSQYLLFGQKKE